MISVWKEVKRNNCRLKKRRLDECNLSLLVLLRKGSTDTIGELKVKEEFLGGRDVLCAIFIVCEKLRVECRVWGWRVVE